MVDTLRSYTVAIDTQSAFMGAMQTANGWSTIFNGVINIMCIMKILIEIIYIYETRGLVTLTITCNFSLRCWEYITFLNIQVDI